VECLYSALDRQDWPRVEAVVSPRVVVEVGSSAPIGWDEWRGNLEAFYRGFPDGRHVIDEVLVVGSHGVSRSRFTGTHTGEFHGLAPSGTKVSVRAIHIDRFQGDMLVAHRGQIDMHGLLQQLKGA
jgi:predicted ester cyclase